MFKVTKTDGETGAKTQCGGTVKTASKAYDLMARMRAQQALGGSNAFSVDRA